MGIDTLQVDIEHCQSIPYCPHAGGVFQAVQLHCFSSEERVWWIQSWRPCGEFFYSLLELLLSVLLKVQELSLCS